MKKHLKRLISLVLVLCTVMALCTTVQAATVTKKSAENIALKDAKLARTAVKNLKTEKEGKEYEVEFRNKKTGDRYEYEIDIRTGRINDVSVKYAHKVNTSRKKVTKAAAINAVVKASGLSKAVVSSGKCRYKKDGKEWIWEIEFRKGRFEYEYEVLAPTGKIIEYSREYK